MLKLFEKNAGIQAAVILVAMVLLWLQPLAHPQPMAPADGFAPLYNLLYALHLSPLAAVILSMVLIMVGGVSLNLMLVHANLVSQNSLLPTLLYTLFMSAGADTLSPTLLVGVVAIAFVSVLMLHGTLLTVTSDKIFGATALIGICSMIYLPSLALLLTYLLIVVSYRLYGWRDWMVMLLGLLAPYIPLWVVLMFTDSLSGSFVSMAETFGTFGLRVGECTFLEGAANTVLLLVFAVNLITLWSRMGEKTVMWQKNATTVMLPAVAALGMLPFGMLFPVNLQLFAIPFTLCADARFSSESRRKYHHPTSRRKWRDRLYGLLFLMVLVAAILC